jgi:serine/threonine-protein kinase HipA
MMKHPNKCLFCLEALPDAQETAYHPKCCRRFFGDTKPPILPYTLSELHELAKHNVERSIAVTGVQPKLSLAFEKKIKNEVGRLTIVGLWGDYILKPPNNEYPELVENEHLTMSLAQLFGIETVPFSFIRLRSGELSYITRRVDRSKAGKLPMEDFCQLSEKLTEYKYRGSVEQAAKIISKYSSNPGLDRTNFLEVVLFSFLTGNADMHLKNYSLLTDKNNEVRLAPAYDLVATRLALPDDNEENALTINGKKTRLKLSDFLEFAQNTGINHTVFDKMLKRFQRKLHLAEAVIGQSFLSANKQIEYSKMLHERAKRLNLE